VKRGRGAAALAVALSLSLSAAAGEAADGWQAFAGSWTVTGERHTLPTEGARPAAVVMFSGSVVLDEGEGDGLGRGFRGEAVGYTDGDSVRVGRFTWTDENDEHVYGVLSGELLAIGQRINGTITGGTGRYDGLAGDFAFTWQYAVEAGDGVVQGRAVRLSGRVRGGGSAR
jgi:hypothetical protein